MTSGTSVAGLAGQEQAIIVSPLAGHTASIIWLHGLGADGHDFETIIAELSLPREHGIKFVFPHAPKRPITVNGGMVMRAWYDVRSNNLSLNEDETAILQSVATLNAYIDGELNCGIAAHRVLIAGFSQGGAIALYTGIHRSGRLGGILVLSAYLPLAERFNADMHAMAKQTPILFAHGGMDEIISLQQGFAAYQCLAQAGYGVKWHEYPMGHSVCKAEIDAIAAWLKNLLC